MSVIDQTCRNLFQDCVTDSQSDLKFLQTDIFADIADL